jgi:hypothetical protein
MRDVAQKVTLELDYGIPRSTAVLTAVRRRVIVRDVCEIGPHIRRITFGGERGYRRLGEVNHTNRDYGEN